MNTQLKKLLNDVETGKITNPVIARKTRNSILFENKIDVNSIEFQEFKTELLKTKINNRTKNMLL